MKLLPVLTFCILCVVSVPALAIRSIICYVASGTQHCFASNLPCTKVPTGGPHNTTCTPVNLAILGPGGGPQIASNPHLSVEVDTNDVLRAYRLNSVGMVTEIFVLADLHRLVADNVVTIGADTQNIPSASSIISTDGVELDSSAIILEVLILDPLTSNVKTRRSVVMDEKTMVV